MRTMNKIVGEQLYHLHCKVSASPVKDPTPMLIETLDRICAVPYELDEELFYVYKGVVEKAAGLACEIARVEPFPSDNQALAMLAMLTLLELNGQGVTHYRDDLWDLKERIAACDYTQCCQWIVDHSVPRRIEME